MQCSTSQVSAGQLRCPAPQQRASGHCRAWTTSRTNRHGASSTPQLHVPRAVQQSLSQAPQQSHPQSQRGSARSNKPAPLPEPAAHQQTLRRSFVLGGIGLHTGEFTHIRVVPAFAAEGRYFVRVAPGTISPLWETEQPEARELEEIGTSSAPSANEAANQEWNAKLFFSFIEGQESGTFSGTFAEYLQQRSGVAPDTLLIDAEVELKGEEEPSAGQPGEERLPAATSSLQQGHRWCSVLGEGEAAIWGAEHLLAALECCGVDNARIEIEGGQEVPIVDGSALGWAAQVQRAGLRVATAAGGAGSAGAVPRSVSYPQEVITVQDGESFVAFYPGPTARVTVGVDCSAEAPVIGSQWFTWSPEEAGNEHFRWALAPARTFYPSVEAVQALMDEGLLQGGADYVSIIGVGDDWLDATEVRFPSDEPARHSVVDLLGDLSLLASPGGRGLPAGHVVAYRPSHALHAAFIQELQRAINAAPAS